MQAACGAALCGRAAAAGAAPLSPPPLPAAPAGVAAAAVPCRRSSRLQRSVSSGVQRQRVCCSSAGSGWQAPSSNGCSSSGIAGWPHLPGQRWGPGRCEAASPSSSAPSSTSSSSTSGSSSSSSSSSVSSGASGNGLAPGSSCLATPTGWHPLDAPAIWKGTEEQAVFRQATPYPLTPSWKVILLSDGSVTRHLQLMTNQRVEVECLEMRSIGHERTGLPPATAQIPGPLVQRQVMLHIPDPHSKAYVYATSWWNADTVDQYLRDRSQPIWVSLSQGRTELYRDILQLELGNCPYLEERFQAKGPFWGRQYLFWHNQEPLTLIYEVFSTALEDFLGPQRQR